MKNKNLYLILLTLVIATCLSCGSALGPKDDYRFLVNKQILGDSSFVFVDTAYVSKDYLHLSLQVRGIFEVDERTVRLGLNCLYEILRAEYSFDTEFKGVLFHFNEPNEISNVDDPYIVVFESGIEMPYIDGNVSLARCILPLIKPQDVFIFNEILIIMQNKHYINKRHNDIWSLLFCYDSKCVQDLNDLDIAISYPDFQADSGLFKQIIGCAQGVAERNQKSVDLDSGATSQEEF